MRTLSGWCYEETRPPASRLLRAGGERPCGCPAAEQRNELAAPRYSAQRRSGSECTKGVGSP